MAGIQGPTAYYKDGSAVLNESDRLVIQLDEKVAYLNIEKSMLLLLAQKTAKKAVRRMEHRWLTQERKKDFVAITAFGGLWQAGADTSGTVTVATADVFLFSPGDVFSIPGKDLNQNYYITAANQSTGVITAQLVDLTGTVDHNATSTPINLFRIGNSFESGTGVGTIKSEQPTREYNYVQIFQDPIGITTTGSKLSYRGQAEIDKMRMETGVDHAFSIEKALFFGERQRKASGLMAGQYEQWFMGGLIDYISTNVLDAAGGSAALTQTEFGNWMIDWTQYAKSPFCFSGELIYEALTLWSDQYLQITRNESTLGMAVTKYLTPYGTVVAVLPHRELLTGTYLGGMAFGVDMSDIEYRYLDGLNTHIVKDTQAPGAKLKVDEYRTWASLKVGNEKRHGLLRDVTSITT